VLLPVFAGEDQLGLRVVQRFNEVRQELICDRQLVLVPTLGRLEVPCQRLMPSRGTILPFAIATFRKRGAQVVDYDIPNEMTLAKYMHLVQAVLLAARGSSDPEIAELAYAVHNLPDLLMRWSDMDEAAQLAALQRFESTYPRWGGHFTGIARKGAPPGWQARWTPRSK